MNEPPENMYQRALHGLITSSHREEVAALARDLIIAATQGGMPPADVDQAARQAFDMAEAMLREARRRRDLPL